MILLGSRGGTDGMDSVANTLCGLEYGGSKANRASCYSECFCHIRGAEEAEVGSERAGGEHARKQCPSLLAGLAQARWQQMTPIPCAG